jgi:hypothetical protein
MLGREVVGHDRRVPSGRDDAEDRREGRVEVHAHRVLVYGLGLLDRAQLGGPRRLELRVLQPLEGVDHVLGLEFPAVMEHDALTQLEGDRQVVVGDLIALRQPRQQVAGAVQDQQGVVDVVEDQGWRVLRVGPGGEIRRLDLERNGEGAAALGALVVCGRRIGP